LFHRGDTAWLASSAGLLIAHSILALEVPSGNWPHGADPNDPAMFRKPSVVRFDQRCKDIAGCFRGQLEQNGV